MPNGRRASRAAVAFAALMAAVLPAANVAARAGRVLWTYETGG